MLLRLRGYRVLARNLRTPAAEIDLLARHRGTLVLVEVKTRRSAPRRPGRLPLSVRQRRRLARAAIWAHARWGAGGGVRVDVVSVEFPWYWLPWPRVRIARAIVGEETLARQMP